MYRIFIVEDDETIAAQIKKHLEGWGYGAACARDFQRVQAEIAAFAPHLILLDISLPGISGFHVCEELRKRSKVPVIFISSASDNMNIVMAMSMGGDDFISKPFDLRVLSAKVQAMLRRSYDFSSDAEFLECGGVRLYPAGAAAECGGTRLELTKNEYRILLVLFENRGRVVSRETLMQRLWETDSFVDENTLTVNIARLRKKLAGAGVEDLIATKKGLGYLVR